MPELIVNGTTLHYEESGSGSQAIVFSHGLLWSSRMYDAQVKALEGRYRCVTYDHRGQGESATSPTAYDMETLADDAAVLIEKLAAGPCHFVGLSMGGFVGLRLALWRPELLRSLVLVDSAADDEPSWNALKYRLMELLSRTFGQRLLLGPTMKTMFARPFLTDPARTELRRTMQERLLALDAARLRTALEAVVTRRGLFGELWRVRIPTLVVEGAKDVAIVPARARATAHAIAGARYVEIPRAGHTSTVEEPAAVSAALESFFAGVPG